MGDNISVLIASDICTIRRAEPLFKKGNTNAIFNNLNPILKDADAVVFNLECPLIQKPSPMRKTGPNLGAPQDCILGLKKAGFKFVNLANNHIMDHGKKGFFNTLNVCRKAGMITFGGGQNLIEAKKIKINSVCGTRIAFFGVAEHEWSIASLNEPGANPLDLKTFIREVKSCQGNFDSLVVLYHGGVQGYPFPTPRQQDVCRFMIEEGASAVICQHTHVAGCYERYHEGIIIYGQGDFVFDYGHHYSPEKNRGFLVRLNFRNGQPADFEMIPYTQFGLRPGVWLIKNENARTFLEQIEERSRKILNPSFVRENWEEFSRKRKESYLSWLYGYSRAISYMVRKLGLQKFMHHSEYISSMANLIGCESHREALETILEMKINRS